MLPRVFGTVCQVGQDEPFLASDGILVTSNRDYDGAVAGKGGGMGEWEIIQSVLPRTQAIFTGCRTQILCVH